MAEVAKEVLEIIAKKIPGGGKEVQLDNKLMDLGLESVDFLEMMFDLEVQSANVPR